MSNKQSGGCGCVGWVVAFVVGYLAAGGCDPTPTGKELLKLGYTIRDPQGIPVETFERVYHAVP